MYAGTGSDKNTGRAGTSSFCPKHHRPNQWNPCFIIHPEFFSTLLVLLFLTPPIPTQPDFKPPTSLHSSFILPASPHLSDIITFTTPPRLCLLTQKNATPTNSSPTSYSSAWTFRKNKEKKMRKFTVPPLRSQASSPHALFHARLKDQSWLYGMTAPWGVATRTS